MTLTEKILARLDEIRASNHLHDDEAIDKIHQLELALREAVLVLDGKRDGWDSQDWFGKHLQLIAKELGVGK